MYKSAVSFKAVCFGKADFVNIVASTDLTYTCGIGTYFNQ